MCRIHQAVRAILGSTCAKAFIVLTAVQFHLPFYMSRTLPNTFALAVVSFGTADWLEAKHPRRLISLLAFATVRVPAAPLCTTWFSLTHVNPYTEVHVIWTLSWSKPQQHSHLVVVLWSAVKLCAAYCLSCCSRLQWGCHEPYAMTSGETFTTLRPQVQQKLETCLLQS